MFSEEEIKEINEFRKDKTYGMEKINMILKDRILFDWMRLNKINVIPIRIKGNNIEFKGFFLIRFTDHLGFCDVGDIGNFNSVGGNNEIRIDDNRAWNIALEEFNLSIKEIEEILFKRVQYFKETKGYYFGYLENRCKYLINKWSQIMGDSGLKIPKGVWFDPFGGDLYFLNKNKKRGILSKIFDINPESPHAPNM